VRNDPDLLEIRAKSDDEPRFLRLSEGDRETLQREVAGLPSEIATDDIESRLFDLTALRMQLALVEADERAFEQHRKRVVEIAMLLEEKGAVPAVAAQLEYLAAVQESGFWEGMSLAGLEELRLRLRGLVTFLDKKKRTIVYTDFKDEVLGVREEQAVYIPKMTGVQYEKKVNDYLRNHLNHIVIHRLRTNQPLTELDLKGLENRWSRSAKRTARRCYPICWPAARRHRSPISCAAWSAWTARRPRRPSRSS
jgi:type I restriction enzyme, R subunit